MVPVVRLWIVFWAIFYTNDAYADCKLSLSGLKANYVMDVEADSVKNYSLTKKITFNVENSGSSNCYYFVAMDGGISGDLNYNRRAKITHPLPVIAQQANSDSISYQLYSQSVTPSNIVKTLNDAVFHQNVLGALQIRPGQRLSESFLIHVPAQNLPNLIAESYDDDVMLTLYQSPTPLIDFVNDCPSCLEEDQRLLNIQLRMINYVTLSIGDEYNPNKRQGLLNFDELETNKQRSFDVYVGGRSGDGVCSVTISSEKGSKLVHEAINTPKVHDAISYRVNARPLMGNPIVAGYIDVSTPSMPVKLADSSIPFLCGNNNEGMMALEVFITIGDVANKTSGVYRDTLIIEVTIGL